jgi:hypothetical protein
MPFTVTYRVLAMYALLASNIAIDDLRGNPSLRFLRPFNV